LIFLAAHGALAATNDFQRQVITLPANASVSRFADLDGHGRLDLLALDPVERKLLIYRQRASGFTNVPDQAIDLPKRTAWITPFDVEPHPGIELLMSTDTGLVYFRQENGRFESEPRALVQAEQVFVDDVSPRLILLAGPRGISNVVVPVISATQALEYRKNDSFEWSHGPPIALVPGRTSWRGTQNEWMMGSASSQGLHVQQSFAPTAKNDELDPPDNDGIRELRRNLEKAGPRHRHEEDRVDVNGDGREDLVIWQIIGEVETRTDIYIFLRGADGRFPERPTQVLHGRGFPIPIRSPFRASPVGDLKGDGTNELVLIEIKGMLASADRLLDMALSQGLDWVLTIRTFDHGAFSRSPNATVTFKSVLPMEWQQRPVFIGGDFNGDGRPDLVIRRSTTLWNVLLSVTDGRWFDPRAAMAFEAPAQGDFEFNDLNGDGRGDIALRSWDGPQLYIFLSQSQRTKGGSP
jgi:hypothetical protein